MNFLIHIFLFQITFCIYGCLFIFEDMTATMVLCGIISQVLHLTLLPSFPYFALTSPQFILAAGTKNYFSMKSNGYNSIQQPKVHSLISLRLHFR